MREQTPFEAPIEAQKDNQPIRITPEYVEVLGVRIDRAREAGPRTPEEKEFETFVEDKDALELLQIIAKGVALNQPTMLEGEQAIGKSKGIEYLAHLANREVYRMSLNGQTDTTDLIGKWVPQTDTLRQRLVLLLKNPALCKSSEARKLIEERVVIKQLTAYDTESDPSVGKGKVGLSREEMEAIATAEGIEVPEGDWVWEDGDVPRAMERGAWLVLDEANTCEPQILVRLNSLLERGGKLVLSENGSRVVRKHEDFRVFTTANPPGGEFRGRVPFSAEYLSRWNYQNIGALSVQTMTDRMFEGYGLPSREVGREKMSFVRAEELPDTRDMVSRYGREWLQEFRDKFQQFAKTIIDMRKKNEIARDQEQRFQFDMRDFERFRDYVAILHEPGAVQKTIREAVEYCFANKCKNPTDRKKILDAANLILKIREPKRLDASDFHGEAEQGDRNARERLASVKRSLGGMHLPASHREALSMDQGLEIGVLEEIAGSIKNLNEQLASRFTKKGATPPTLEIPKTPDLTPEHLQALDSVFGEHNVEPLVLPKEADLTDEYWDTLYPKAQDEAEKDTLVSYRPSWWEDTADKDIVGPSAETWGSAYIRAMKREAESLAGHLLLTESIQKPNYTGGKQAYGTKEGNTPDTDPLTPLLKEIFPDNPTRFNHTHQELTEKLIPVLTEKIRQSFTDQGLTTPSFKVILTPALALNLQSTLTHPENSQTTTWEWSSTPLLKQDNTDSGRSLDAGRAENGGAADVGSVPRGYASGDRGFRLSVVWENT